jgi:hypothetical protein
LTLGFTVLLHDLIPFLHQPFHALASLTPGRLAEVLENAFQTLDVARGFRKLTAESLLQLRDTGGLRQAWQGLHELLLGMVDVLQLFEKERLQ